jgi:branched-chain amino acid transport system ATP-binding protein
VGRATDGGAVAGEGPPLNGMPDGGSGMDTGPASAAGGSGRGVHIEELTAGYGSHRVLHGVSLDLPGGITGIFGHNGAGKTTLLRALAGLVRPNRGRMTFGGQDVRTLGRAVGFVPQDDNVFSGLRVDDNLRVAALGLGAAAYAAALRRVFELFPDLGAKRRDRAATLSGGQKKMLAFSMALLQSPRLLLLDEPSAGLAPPLVERMMEVIRRVAAEDGATVLLVEQNIAAAAAVVDGVVVLGQGRVRYVGPSVDERAVRELWGLEA